MRRITMIEGSVGWGMASSVAEDAVSILRTADGGETWLEVAPAAIDTLPGAFPDPARAVFLDGDRAWLMIEPILACGWRFSDCPSIFMDAPGSLWYTRDGGRTWDRRSMPERYIGRPVSFHFVDDKHGWIMSQAYAGAGSSQFVFLRTEDGGSNWETLKSDIHGVHEFSIAVVFADGGNGLMTFGQDGYYILSPYVRWTKDGGESWGEFSPMPAPVDDPELFDLNRDGAPFCGTYQGRLFSPESALVVVLCSQPLGRPGPPMAPLLYSTSDGGSSWQSSPYPGGRIQFLDSQLGWALGEEIYRTRDGGTTWMKLASVPWKGQFSFVDPSRGWAVGEMDSASGRIFSLFKTEDGGRTWIELSPDLAP